MATGSFDSNTPYTPAVSASATNKAYGVAAITTDNCAILAEDRQGFGVYAAGGGTGVFGFSGDGYGVFGESEGGTAVTGSSQRGRGVFASSVDEVAVEATSTNTAGVYANSEQGPGVYAYSVQSTAVYAVSGGDGVHGVAQSTGTGVVGQSPRGLAGAFYGSVTVTGDFTVYGNKSAAVRHPDGSHRLFYSLEAPESWLEDFGTGKLKSGTAKVKLDADFVSLVAMNSCHVFLTPKGNSNGLYVSRQNRDGFEVQEQNGGKATLAFDYRVVAKRKDIRSVRLRKVTKPKAPSVSRPARSKIPERPKLAGTPKLPISA